MTEVEASEQACELDVLYDFYTDRTPDQVRRLEIPRLVERQPGWRYAGVLDAWVRDDGHWWGGYATTTACTAGTARPNCDPPTRTPTGETSPRGGRLPASARGTQLGSSAVRLAI